MDLRAYPEPRRAVADAELAASRRRSNQYSGFSVFAFVLLLVASAVLFYVLVLLLAVLATPIGDCSEPCRAAFQPDPFALVVFVLILVTGLLPVLGFRALFGQSRRASAALIVAGALMSAIGILAVVAAGPLLLVLSLPGAVILGVGAFAFWTRRQLPADRGL
jgi:hypothetical protein